MKLQFDFEPDGWKRTEGEEALGEASAHLLSALQSHLLIPTRFFFVIVLILIISTREREKLQQERKHGRTREPGVWKSRLCAAGQRVYGGIHGQP